MKMNECNLCRELLEMENVVVVGKHSFVLVNLRAIKDGHIMVLPIRHVEEYTELTEQESKEMFGFVEKMSHILHKEYGNPSLTVINPVHRRSERHVHIHLIPSKYGAREYISMVENVPANAEVAAHVRKEIRDRLQRALGITGKI
ncbi:MAG: HIT domain-containing protein [Candidatus Micrarchaeia archaeon]